MIICNTPTVELIDSMGSDITIVNAARVSFAKESEWKDEDAQALQDKDKKLIRYLSEHEHWSPFAHTAVQFRIKAPIFVARQLAKHQVGGVWNEVSRRYVDTEPEFYFPKKWRVRPTDKKQGSGGEHPASDALTTAVCLNVAQIVVVYNQLVDDGIAPEQARMILPQNMMTEWIWTGSLVFFARVCALRLTADSQLESREVVEKISEAIQFSTNLTYSWNQLTKK